MTLATHELEFSRSMFDHYNTEKNIFKSLPGLTVELVKKISKDKNEPEWMLKKRLKGLELFNRTLIPKWGPDLSKLDLTKISFYIRPDAKKSESWDSVPEDIKKTFDRLGIPEAEKKYLSGVGAQYDSEIVYHNLKKEWEEKGVIFEDCDTALQKYPELVKKYFMTKCIPINDHKFIMLHTAVWSGGTFIYIPKNVKVTIPLQAYFRMNAKQGGQFEHTLIIADEGSEVHYIEGCFTKGNLVTSNPDYKGIEEIKGHQKVLTSEGEFKTTKDIQEMPYSGDLYTIEVYGDSTQKIEVTPEHPFLYVDRARKRDRNKIFIPRWNMPLFFKKKDYLCAPINKEVKTNTYYEFEIVKGNNKGVWEKKKINVPLTDEFFRLVGYYLAEGSVSSNSYLNFSFNINEKEYIGDVKQCLKKVFGVTKTLEMVHKKNNGVSVVVCSVELARIFKQLGDKCDKKALLSWMIYETKEHQQEILRGWFRGDGNYYNKRLEKSGWLKESLRINTTSEKLVRQMRDVALRLGVVAFINAHERSHEGRRTMFTLGFTGEHMVKAGELLGIKIKEKVHGKKRASMFGIDENFAYLPIKTVAKKIVIDVPVYNFSVEDHETYTVGGVAVHNCSAPQYGTSSLHAGCVEIFVHKNARVRYSSVENWSKNTFNLNTKRAIVYENGIMEWVNGNMGSCTTMLYPCSILAGRGAKTEMLGIAYAGNNQNQDTGSKVIHTAPDTTSTIRSKSISKDGGISSYRGFVMVNKGSTNAKCNVICDALILDNKSKSNTYPSMKILDNSSTVTHEATVGKISEEKIFYLMSRGLTEEQAIKMVVSGFIEPILKELPLEYAVELNKLIQLEMENSVG
ncbi:SufD family Fe-S cluster assembly protein [Candidatus Woesearchaeota archaeon]|nr:SufD family Fe-S cluster assembly protein [Candidatus Woesearchaeota archaeon]